MERLLEKREIRNDAAYPAPSLSFGISGDLP